MKPPPLKPLHTTSVLSKTKLHLYSKLATDELIRSLAPGKEGALKTRPDGTLMDGHHRIAILRERGVNVDELPRVVLDKY